MCDDSESSESAGAHIPYSSSSNGNANSSDEFMGLPSSHVCGGSASVERGFVTGFTQPDQQSCKSNSSDIFRVITEPREHDIQMNDECFEEPYL